MKKYIFFLCFIFGFVKTEYKRNITSRIISSLFGKELVNENNLTINENIYSRNTEEEPFNYINKNSMYCDCGPVNGDQERIYKGKDVDPPHKYPWAVYITFEKRGVKSICTGSIIHENFILTAAHCFLLGKTLREGTIDTNTMKVHVGDFSRSSVDDIENITQIVQIDGIIIHEEVNLNFFENDIALLRLSKSLDLKSHKELKSICLPYPLETNLNGEMTAIGWGKIKPKGGSAKNLQEGEVSVYEVCLNPNLRSFDSRLLCIYGSFQKSFLCKGDSGGPVMRIKNGRYEIVGVVSFMIGNEGSCASTSGFAYAVNVVKYYDWIWRYLQFTCI